MVVHHVDDEPHAQIVSVRRQALQVLHRAVGGVHPAIVHDRVGRAHRALAPLDPDGMDRHEPDHVHAQVPDSAQVPPHRLEGALLGVVPDKYGIHHLTAQVLARVPRHAAHRLCDCDGVIIAYGEGKINRFEEDDGREQGTETSSDTAAPCHLPQRGRLFWLPRDYFTGGCRGRKRTDLESSAAACTSRAGAFLRQGACRPEQKSLPC